MRRSALTRTSPVMGIGLHPNVANKVEAVK